MAGQPRTQAAGAAADDESPGPGRKRQPGGRGRGSKGQAPSEPVKTRNSFSSLEADEEVDACGAKTEAMDRGDHAGGQQAELSPAGAKRPRPAGGSPDGSPVPKSRWDDRDNGDGACSLPAGTVLILEDQTPIEPAAGTGAHASATPAQEREYKSEASETSGEWSEDKEATQTKPQDTVKLLRQQEEAELEAKNDSAIGALYSIDPTMVEKLKAMHPPSTWIHVYANDLTGVDKFAALSQVTEVLDLLQYTDRVFGQERRFGREFQFMSLEFSPTQQAQLARQRIIEEHKGVEWPPPRQRIIEEQKGVEWPHFAVMYASTRFILRLAAEDA